MSKTDSRIQTEQAGKTVVGMCLRNCVREAGMCLFIGEGSAVSIEAVLRDMRSTRSNRDLRGTEIDMNKNSTVF
jgi:hypothetical protein